ncbi:transcriptional regulator [Salinarimonas soli]|uniref:Transcriptional regulator n=2 Tax=Salinarimonas soli TaxID=1638099 RepID=A0A5B2V9Z4_9HYPH|nr:transcriptional regulator [Salinarimonas soli]
MPHGHALDALLAGYACGLLSAPLHTLVASHLAISPKNRAFVSNLETANGSALAELSPAPVRDREARLNAIFEQDVDEPIRRRVTGDALVPAPLARYLGMDLGAVPWRTLMPGVKEFRAEGSMKAGATLYWIRAGRRMPAHTHEGSEYTLVLQGAFSDVAGRYERGDIAIGDDELDHCPTADASADCLCFAVTDAPLRLTGPIGRIVQRFIGT